MRIEQRLDRQMDYWRNVENSSLWTREPNLPMPIDIEPVATFDPKTGRTLLALQIRAYHFTKSEVETCGFFAGFLERTSGANEDQPRWRANLLANTAIPRATVAATQPEDLVVAAEQLLKNTDFLVTLFEAETHRMVECRRPALGDTALVMKETAPRR